MTARATFRQSDLTKAIKAAQDAGMAVEEIVIGPTGARLKFVAESVKPADGPRPKEWPKA